MHFRVRNKVVQLVRTSYVAGEKKPEAKVVGRLLLGEPQLTDELKALLTPAEQQETLDWIGQHHRRLALEEELAARQLAEQIGKARRWLKREKQTPAARQVAEGIREEARQLRQILKSLVDD